MTTMEKTREAVEAVRKAGADETVRITRRIEIGHAIQQGDLYIFRVPDNHPRGTERGSQLAQGTSNGARHCAEGAKVYEGTSLPSGVKPPFNCEPKEITGPVIVAEGTWTLTHPEHPHHQLPAGTWQCVHQFDPATMRRVVD